MERSGCESEWLSERDVRDLYRIPSLSTHRSLRWIRENKQVSVLHLDFTVTVEVLGQREVVELKPGGSKVPLTDENKVCM